MGKRNIGSEIWEFGSDKPVEMVPVATTTSLQDEITKALVAALKTNPDLLKQVIGQAAEVQAPTSKSFLDVDVPAGILPIAQMSHNRRRSETERKSQTWRKSVAFWANVFMKAREPACFLFSKIDKPEIFTCAIKEVSTEGAVVDYLVGRDGVQEKTYLFCNVYGLESPTPDWRVKAKRKMSELYGYPLVLDPVPAPTEQSKEKRKAATEEAGRNYEYFLGYHFNDSGYHVEYHGLQKQKKDEGVDFILTKFGVNHLVQARNWSKKNKISSPDAEIILNRMKDFAAKHELPNVGQYILIYTNAATISDETKAHAESIGLTLMHVPQREVPLLKCIVKNGHKIVYSPGDTHYLSVDMLIDKNRWWAWTMDEASAKGHRPPNVAKPNK